MSWPAETGFDIDGQYQIVWSIVRSLIKSYQTLLPINDLHLLVSVQVGLNCFWQSISKILVQRRTRDLNRDEKAAIVEELSDRFAKAKLAVVTESECSHRHYSLLSI